MKKWLSIILVLSIILTIPSIYKRAKVEWKNNTYEMIIPYDEIMEMIDTDSEFTVDDVFLLLKESGLTSISIEVETLDSLQKRGIISYINREKLLESIVLSGKNIDSLDIPEKKGLFIYVDEGSEFIDKIEYVFDEIETITIGKNQLYFVPGEEKKLKEKPIGFNEDAIALIKGHGFQLVPRLPSLTADKDGRFIINQVLALKDKQVNGILFSEKEVLSHPDKSAIQKWANQFKKAGFSIYSIEFFEQKSFSTVATIMDYDVIRLHSIDLDSDKKTVELVDQVIRAVKERNLRALFIHLNSGNPDKVLEETVDYLTTVRSEMPKLFKLGKAETFDEFKIPLWEKAAALLAAIAFAGLAAHQVLRNRLAYVAIAGMALLSVAHLVTGRAMFIKLVALAIAVIAPVYAIIPKKGQLEKRHIVLIYARAALISLIGIWIIVALLNGNQFLVKIDAFKGVKLVYIIPILFMVVYAVWGSTRLLLNASIRYWHLIIIGILGAVVYYYISRTGNEGTASSLELSLRGMMENILYVRPRFKEVLIGFPFFVLALYVMKQHKQAGLYLLIPSVIGYLSLVNTFTHLHIPLYVSLLRSVYSLAGGLVIGLIFIWLYKLGVKGYHLLKLRWQQ